MSADRKADLFVPTEEVMAPILAVAVAGVLGLAALHFSDQLGLNLIAKAKTPPATYFMADWPQPSQFPPSTRPSSQSG